MVRFAVGEHDDDFIAVALWRNPFNDRFCVRHTFICIGSAVGCQLLNIAFYRRKVIREIIDRGCSRGIGHKRNTIVSAVLRSGVQEAIHSNFQRIDLHDTGTIA